MKRSSLLLIGSLTLIVLLGTSCGNGDSPAASTVAAETLTVDATSTTLAVSTCTSLGRNPEDNSRLRWPPLERGDASRRVLLLQYLLLDRKIALIADGQFGPATEAAVKEFQVSQGNAETGVMTSRDWQTLLSDCNVETGPDKVRALQAALQIPSYNQPITGVMDSTLTTNLDQSRTDSGSSSSGAPSIADWLTLVGVGD